MTSCLTTLHRSVSYSVRQKRRSSRQVKRKRYTEDLEFRISEDDDSGDDSPAPKSPSSSSQQQVHPGFLFLVQLEIGYVEDLKRCYS